MLGCMRSAGARGSRGKATEVGPRLAAVFPRQQRPREKPRPRPIRSIAASGHALCQHRQVHAVEAVEERIHQGLVKALQEPRPSETHRPMLGRA